MKCQDLEQSRERAAKSKGCQRNSRSRGNGDIKKGCPQKKMTRKKHYQEEVQIPERVAKNRRYRESREALSEQKYMSRKNMFRFHRLIDSPLFPVGFPPLRNFRHPVCPGSTLYHVYRLRHIHFM